MSTCWSVSLSKIRSESRLFWLVEFCRRLGISWNSTGPTPTRTPTPTLGMRLSCYFVNVHTIAYRVRYTYTRVHACIPNEHRACRTNRRGSSCVFGSWRTKLFLLQAEQESRRTRRHPRIDPRAEVGEDVRVGAVSASVSCNASYTHVVS